MTDQTEPKPKRPYSRPTLTSFGTIASLTRTGTGSQPENRSSNSKNKQRV